jgi:hypothetical protein
LKYLNNRTINTPLLNRTQFIRINLFGAYRDDEIMKNDILMSDVRSTKILNYCILSRFKMIT